MSTHPDGADPRSAADDALARFLEGEPEPGDGAALAAAMERDPEFAAEVRRLLLVDDLLRQANELDDGAFADAVRTRLATEGDDAFTRSIAEQLQDALPLAEPCAPERRKSRAWRNWFLIAASLLLAVGGLGVARFALAARGGGDVARLVNAQDCRWAEGGDPAGGLGAGKVLQLRSGLAELTFSNGADVVLQGPATLELLSGQSARLVRGRLSARVPEPARGFTVLSPAGRVVDLGTEFGVDVGEDGTAEVHVFRGEVTADRGGKPVSVQEAQTARITEDGVSVGPAADAGRYVREIVLPPVIVPRTLTLDFRAAVDGTLTDRAGLGTGLTHRLPGTGADLPARDPHLRLVRSLGRLELMTTQSDLHGQRKLGQGEYVGVRLADLGFTGSEDFAVTAEFVDAQSLEQLDQFGLYAGSRSDRNVRGGLIRPAGKPGIGDSVLFFVHNNGGTDTHQAMVGLVKAGNKISMTLRRVGGQYSYSVKDHIREETTEISNRHPEFLDREADMHAGLFGATPWRDYPRKIQVEKFTATVWTRQQP